MLVDRDDGGWRVVVEEGEPPFQEYTAQRVYVDGEPVTGDDIVIAEAVKIVLRGDGIYVYTPACAAARCPPPEGLSASRAQSSRRG